MRACGLAVLLGVSLAAAAPAHASAGLVDIIGNSKWAYAAASVAVAAIPVYALVYFAQKTRRSDGRPRMLATWTALGGVGLLGVALGIQILRYHPFDPKADQLHLICHPLNIAASDKTLDVSIDYVPDRRCVNGKTAYEANRGGLERIILYKAANGSSYETRALRIVTDPYAQEPLIRFTRIRSAISAAAYAQLLPIAPKKPICPDANEGSIREALGHVTGVRKAAARMQATPIQTTEWRCQPH